MAAVSRLGLYGGPRAALDADYSGKEEYTGGSNLAVHRRGMVTFFATLILLLWPLMME